MIDRIKELEKQALSLEPNAEQRAKLLENVNRYCEEFLDRTEEDVAFRKDYNTATKHLYDPIEESGLPIEQLLSIYQEEVEKPGLNPASGGHLAYIPGGGLYPSALGDMIAAVTNRYAGVFFGGPGAVRMENALIQWMGELIGWKSGFAGNLASGGSIANLIGIVAARDAKKVDSTNVRSSVIYGSAQQHHCVAKAINIGGLRECIFREVPLDPNYRIIPAKLEEMIEQDISNGLNPFLVIANAGTTDTGAIDPLEPIGLLAKKHDMWYHIDGAYGAFFILCEEIEPSLRALTMADSLVMDPHKGLFLPYGLGVVLVKNAQHLIDSHRLYGNYMQDATNDNSELSPAEVSPELTKHFRGLRLWLPLRLFGLAPFRAGVTEKHLLAKYFHNRIQELECIEVGPSPELSVVTYRFLPPHGDANKFNAALIDEIHKDGRVFLSSTSIDGVFILRFAALAFRTHLNTVNLCIEVLKEKSLELLGKEEWQAKPQAHSS